MKIILTVIVLVFLALAVILDLTGVCSQVIEYATPFVLGFTLIVLIFYTASTNELAKATQKHVEIVTREYEHSRWPVVSFLLGLDRKYENITGEGFMRGDSTPVTLTNHSGLDAVVLVELNFEIDGKRYQLGSDEYTGKEPWNLQAHGAISTPGFNINEIIAAQKACSTDELHGIRKRGRFKVNLEIIIKHKYAPPKKIFEDHAEVTMIDYYLEKAPLYYYLDYPDSRRWIFNVKFKRSNV